MEEKSPEDSLVHKEHIRLGRSVNSRGLEAVRRALEGRVRYGLVAVLS